MTRPKDVRPVYVERSTVLRYEMPTYAGHTGLVTLLLHAADFIQRLDDQYRVSDVVITAVESGYDWGLTIYVEQLGEGNDA
jgi:hypothetical protein